MSFSKNFTFDIKNGECHFKDGIQKYECSANVSFNLNKQSNENFLSKSNLTKETEFLIRRVSLSREKPGEIN